APFGGFKASFFFSSRRRHTRWPRDWSSDVCSSDLRDQYLIGRRIGSYQILSLLGEGGMGAVYRADDTKLKRDVALKILPEAFTHDPGRMARFQREAEVLASLNHPNIAQIYGVEDRALVMELV